MRRYLYFVTFVAALAGLMFGFETAVINGAIHYVAEHFQLNPFMKGFVVGTALAGCVFGALFIGKPGDKYGRRYMLKIMAFLFLISMIICIDLVISAYSIQNSKDHLSYLAQFDYGQEHP